MTILIHGDDTEAALNRLLEIKKKYAEALTVVAKEATPVSLEEAFASQSLFGDQKIIIIENPGSNKKLFETAHLQGETLLYESRKLVSAEITGFQKKIPDIMVEEFKLDPVVFKFVESLAPKNQKIMLPLWQKYIANEEPEIALAMLARQIRLLLGGDDFDKLSPWQKQRISTQAKLFTPQQLITFHSKLLEVDFKNKTGQAPLDLASSLELLLFSL